MFVVKLKVVLWDLEPAEEADLLITLRPISLHCLLTYGHPQSRTWDVEREMVMATRSFTLLLWPRHDTRRRRECVERAIMGHYGQAVRRPTEIPLWEKSFSIHLKFAVGLRVCVCVCALYYRVFQSIRHIIL